MFHDLSTNLAQLSDEGGRWARVAAVLRGAVRGPEAWMDVNGEVVARWSRVFAFGGENEGISGEDRFLEQDMLRAREMIERRHGVTQADAEAKTAQTKVEEMRKESTVEEEEKPESMDVSEEEIDDGLYMVEESMVALEVDDWEKRIVWDDAPPKNKRRAVAFDQGEIDTGRWIDDVSFGWKENGRELIDLVCTDCLG